MGNRNKNTIGELGDTRRRCSARGCEQLTKFRIAKDGKGYEYRKHDKYCEFHKSQLRTIAYWDSTYANTLEFNNEYPDMSADFSWRYDLPRYENRYYVMLYPFRVIDSHTDTPLEIKKRKDRETYYVILKDGNRYVTKPVITLACEAFTGIPHERGRIKSYSSESFYQFMSPENTYWKKTISESDRKRIFEFSRKGLSLQQIASKFHVGRSHIYRILNKK